jgi:polar amino acid transport system substrate-binding protein
MLVVGACSGTAATGSPGASGASSPTASGTLGRWQQQGFVRLGYEEAAPYSYVDPTSGELTGLDIDISNAIFKSLGMPAFDPVLTTMPAYIPGLMANRWDFTGNSIYILPARCAQVAFTNPLHVSIETALVPKGNPKNINSWSGIVADPSIKIGISEGANDQALYKQDGVPDSRVSVFPDDQTAAQAVADGRVDVWLNDILSLNWMVKTGSIGDTTEVVTDFTPRLTDGQPQKRYLGVAARYDEIDFLNAYNAALKNLITSGQLLQIGSKYGLTQNIVPDPNYGSEQICPAPAAPWPSSYHG